MIPDEYLELDMPSLFPHLWHCVQSLGLNIDPCDLNYCSYNSASVMTSDVDLDSQRPSQGFLGAHKKNT